MIGGCDLVLEGRPTRDDLVLAEGLIGNRWPRAILETSEGRWAPLGELVQLGSRGHTELFVYRDEEAAREWNAHGLTTTNADAMIVLMIEDGAISFVVDEPSSTSGELVVELIRNIVMNRVHHPFVVPPVPRKEAA